MSAIAVGEITIVDLHDEDVHIGTTAPAELKDGRLWLDTSTVPNVMKRWDAATQKWIKASPTEASDIGAETPSGAQDKADGAEDAAKTYAEQKAQAARDAARNNLAYQLGYSSYTDMVAKARTAGKTIIAGGYLNTELLEANSIVASKIAVLPDNKIASASTWHAKETTSGAQSKADAAENAAKTYAESQAEAAEAAAKTYAEAKAAAAVTNFISTTYNPDKATLEGMIDGKIDTWFYPGTPTLNNSPASSWTTTDLRDKHLDDLYYDTGTGATAGYVYRFTKTGSTYGWTRIKDADITAAMGAASTAQDTADGKRRVFTTTPVPPYDVGDLWAGGPSGELKRCKTKKTAGQSYAAADWEPATKYTDDTKATAAQTAANAAQTAANNAAAAASTANQAALDAAGLAAGKGKVIFQSTAPAAADRDANNLWIDTTGGANTPKRWNGSAWVAVTDKAATDAASAAAAANTAASNAASAAAAANTAASNAASAAAAAQTKADAAASAAATAQTAASNAANAASTAQTAANTANALLADIASDSKLTPSEKQAVKKEWDVIVAEKPTIEAQATTYGITTEKTAYTSAYNTLSTYITSLLSSLTTTSTIVGNTFRTNFKNYYDKRALLLKAVSDVAKTYADSVSSSAKTEAKTYAEQQAADAKQDAQDYASQILKNLADGEYPDGTFITGKSIYTPEVYAPEVYAGRMHGLRGTFHDLLAGNPEGSRIEMGEKLIAAQAKVSRPEYAIASGFGPGHEPSKAFDGDTGTYWERNVGDFVWIGQEFPEPVCVKAVRRYCASGPLGGDALLFCLIYYDESAGTWRNLDYLHSLYGEGWSQQNVNPGNVYAKKWACSINTIAAPLPHNYVCELEFYDERFSPFVDGYATKTQKAFELNAAGIGTFDGFFFMDGYPAGMIIEQGSNSNGSWVRWSNGLQMCWGLNTFPGTGWTGSGDKWYLTGQSLTFPVTFDSNPTFLGTTRDSSIATRSAKLANFNVGTSAVTAVSFNGWGTTSSSFYLHWLAIGWWK